MSRVVAYAALITLLAAAGCASAPETRDQASAAVAAATASDTSGTVVPDAIVDANELAARTPPPVICRQMLKQGSNVIIQQCLTAKDWKEFERREAQQAQSLVRMMQRGAYR